MIAEAELVVVTAAMLGDWLGGIEAGKQGVFPIPCHPGSGLWRDIDVHWPQSMKLCLGALSTRLGEATCLFL